MRSLLRLIVLGSPFTRPGSAVDRPFSLQQQDHMFECSYRISQTGFNSLFRQAVEILQTLTSTTSVKTSIYIICMSWIIAISIADVWYNGYYNCLPSSISVFDSRHVHFCLDLFFGASPAFAISPVRCLTEGRISRQLPHKRSSNRVAHLAIGANETPSD